ncbi:protein DGS1, mitochondrial-like isoform X2 [Lycium barbarum]|uniref:protein DGS1, mitochondrial-like isoform X2 n=1 Tax=Lycium barbarum TaxID=112863 RepID=UPI00293EB455|nr:protein DGS1, mitochondrial-like isoform X2 [Lycium barbarum]
MQTITYPVYSHNVGSGEGKVYADLAPTFRGREAVSERPSAQEKTRQKGQIRTNISERYERELMHPIQNLVSGELARALLIQVQKLKLNIEKAMLELDKILRANGINFAILAALPAFFLSLIVIMVMRGWIKQLGRSLCRKKDTHQNIGYTHFTSNCWLIV